MKSKEMLSNTIKKIDGAYAPASIRTYKSNFEKFITFCDEIKECALPATNYSVERYDKTLSGGHLKSNSIRIAVAAIATIHKLSDSTDATQHPEFKQEVRLIYRTHGRES